VDLELPKDVQEKLAVLQSLSEKAGNGDKEARKELRRRCVNPLRRSSYEPQILVDAGSGR